MTPPTLQGRILRRAEAAVRHSRMWLEGYWRLVRDLEEIKLEGQPKAMAIRRMADAILDFHLAYGYWPGS